MVNLDNSETDGHRNRFVDENTIIEQFDTNKIYTMARFKHGLTRPYRLVFEKKQSKNGRKYIFQGLYKLEKTDNDDYTRILKFVSGEWDF